MNNNNNKSFGFGFSSKYCSDGTTDYLCLNSKKSYIELLNKLLDINEQLLNKHQNSTTKSANYKANIRILKKTLNKLRSIDNNKRKNAKRMVPQSRLDRLNQECDVYCNYNLLW